MSKQIVVHDPTGFPPEVTGKRMASRLESLEGKTIYLVDARYDTNTGVMMRQIQAWFRDNMPAVDARFIEMKEAFVADEGVFREIHTNGHGAIVGVGI